VKLLSAVTLYELVEGDDGVKARYPREVQAGQLISLAEARAARLKERTEYVKEWDEDQRQLRLKYNFLKNLQDRP